MLTHRVIQLISVCVLWNGLDVVNVDRFDSDLQECNVDGKLTDGELDAVTMTEIRVTAAGSLQ